MVVHTCPIKKRPYGLSLNGAGDLPKSELFEIVFELKHLLNYEIVSNLKLQITAINAA